ncbi:MAG: PEP-CTERM sorting domain-containing protein [Planctomycetaceae bacterium]|nr:PEP-CTERM sorting domain-containing protein [Planctomycetaceae bacterium]
MVFGTGTQKQQTNGSDTVENVVNGQNYWANLDANWTAAYLGKFEIKTPDFSTAGDTPEKRAKYEAYTAELQQALNSGVLKKLEEAVQSAKFTNAFIYNTNTFPFGTSSKWSAINTYIDSAWIGEQSGTEWSNGDISHAMGYYAYQTSFTIGSEETFKYLTGYAATDNMLVGVMLDGTLLDKTYWDFRLPDATYNGITYDKMAYAFGITNEDFQLKSGLHTLTLLVANYSWEGKGNPTGLLLEAELSNELVSPNLHIGAATPEPATLAVFGLGLAGLAALRRRKR